MKRILLTIAYMGTNYNGWQRQKHNPNTIEEKVIDAIFLAINEKVELVGSSRTDAGVHAFGQLAHFDSDTTIPAEKIALVINRFLPNDIRIVKSIEVPSEFSARFNVVNKTYRYITYLSDIDLPYYNNRALRLYGGYNIEAMKKACAYLIGTHDFAAFKKSDTEYETTVRTINSANVLVNGKEIVFEINGDGFMHNMIRIIVGTLLDIGREKKTPEYILELIKSKSRIMAGKTVIPDGLYLKEIFTTLDK